MTDLVIDAFDLSILTIEGGTGRTITFTENATETTGGSFYDPDGPELTGSDRAVKKYTYDATTGKWLALKHTVSFNAKSDEPVPDGRVFDGGILTEPTEPADFSRYGYIFEGWFLDSGFNNAYDFSTPVTSDFTLYAKWSPAFLNTITSSAGFGGHIDPTDTQVPYDGVIFSFQANAGYRIKDVKVDGVSVDYDVDDDGIGTYTFLKVEESHTIHVEFEAYYVISVNNPGNGSITADDYEPSYGDDVTITITSNEGYTLDALTDNDVNVFASAVETDAGVWTYTISSVESDHDIFVTFTKITYEMTVDWSGEGSVSPDSDFVVEHGNNATFTFWTDEGHCICEVLADGISVDFNIDEDGRGTYTFLNITADHTFEVIFEIMTHNVVLVPGDGYTLVPAEGYSSPVNHKGSFAFVFSLKEGYSESVPVILMNGTEIATVSNGDTVSMILLNIIEDIEITVDGIVANVYTVTVKSDDKTSFVYVLNENDPVEFIAGPGESYYISVPHGSDLTVQAMPDGEELFQWHNTGTGTANGNILIINVTEDVTVSGALQKEPWTARLNTYEFKMAAAGVVLVVPLLIGIRRLRL
ncbi:MAG: InlB B-repeat-containing protein [Candidatus Methanomethylophilaceae archaeon]